MIVIVEDDPGISNFLVKGLKAEGLTTQVAGTVDAAKSIIAAVGDDLSLVLLDLGLPQGDGHEVLTWLRSFDAATPVIVLTARDDVSYKIAELNAGANDYVTKPFSFDELLARIRAATRMVEQPTSTELVVDELRLDLLAKVAFRDGRRISLAPREWALLELFMRHPTQVLSRQQILDHVWDYSFDGGSNVVDVYVGYLRKKLNGPGQESLIVTVRGAGYRFSDRI
ncbi:MAG: response regulator transcription factor [Actinobacteria bacterium]|jgi:DNA-binding response OmpR family regulator|nr:response regulator transcription factor [Actinomycetota bacterium]